MHTSRSEFSNGESEHCRMQLDVVESYATDKCLDIELCRAKECKEEECQRSFDLTRFFDTLKKEHIASKCKPEDLMRHCKSYKKATTKSANV